MTDGEARDISVRDLFSAFLFSRARLFSVVLAFFMSPQLNGTKASESLAPDRRKQAPTGWMPAHLITLRASDSTLYNNNKVCGDIMQQAQLIISSISAVHRVLCEQREQKTRRYICSQIFINSLFFFSPKSLTWQPESPRPDWVNNRVILQSNYLHLFFISTLNTARQGTLGCIDCSSINHNVGLQFHKHWNEDRASKGPF